MVAHDASARVALPAQWPVAPHPALAPRGSTELAWPRQRPEQLLPARPWPIPCWVAGRSHPRPVPPRDRRHSQGQAACRSSPAARAILGG